VLADAAALIARSAPLLALTALAGMAVDAWLRGGGHPAPAWGRGVLYGWVAVGTALFALALTGLYARGPILGVAAALAVAGLPAVPRIRRTSRLPGGATWAWSALVAIAALPVLAQVRVPVLEQDSLIHGLALPAQWLLAHRAVWDRLPLNFHLPSPLEAGFALPLLLGDERLAKVAVVSCAAAATLLVPRERAGMCAVLTLALLPVMSLAATAKSDVAAAAMTVGGMVVTGDAAGRRRPLGWALLGCGLAAKFIYAPLALVWLAAFPPPRGARLRAAALLALPSAPWWIAAFATTGDPWYPFAAGIFHPFAWGRLNRETFFSQQLPLWPAGTVAWATLPGAAWRGIRETDAWLLVALPGLVGFRATRRPALAVVAGGLVLLRFAHLVRYTLPAEWMLAMLTAQGLAALGRPTLHVPTPQAPRARDSARTSGPSVGLAMLTAQALAALGRPAASWAAVGLALARIAAVAATPELGLRLAGLAPDAALKSIATTYVTAADRLRAMGVHRVLTVGEGRIYRLPARVAFNGFSGETPVVWQLAKESGDAARLAIRVRQANVPWLLYDLVAVDWITPRYAAFAWDERMLRLWIGFCRDHLALVARPDAFDSWGGAFALYRVARAAGPPAPVWFVPGAEGASLSAKSARDQGRFAEAQAGYASLLKRFPEVGAFHSERGYAYELMHDWSGVLRETRPWIRAGMRDTVNLPTFAEAAVNLGRFDEAEPALQEAIALYPGTRDQNRINLAWTYVYRARRAQSAGAAGPAAAWLAKADRELGQVGAWTDPRVEGPRRECVAAATALHAALAAR